MSLACCQCRRLTPIVAKEWATVTSGGAVLMSCHPIKIDRFSKDATINVVNEIKKRTSSNGIYPQIAIAVEGTTTIGKSLLRFKTGTTYK